MELYTGKPTLANDNHLHYCLVYQQYYVQRKMSINEKPKISAPQETVGVSNSYKRSTPNKRRVNSNQLLAGEQEIVIEHGDDEYRLRITSKGKLILTK